MIASKLKIPLCSLRCVSQSKQFTIERLREFKFILDADIALKSEQRTKTCYGNVNFENMPAIKFKKDYKSVLHCCTLLICFIVCKY